MKNKIITFFVSFSDEILDMPFSLESVAQSPKTPCSEIIEMREIRHQPLQVGPPADLIFTTGVPPDQPSPSAGLPKELLRVNVYVCQVKNKYI